MPTHTEAPFSWNTKYIDRDGFVCQVTVRAVTAEELSANVKALKSMLEQGKAQPAADKWLVANGNGQASSSQARSSPPRLENGQADPGWCPIHNCQMKRREKDGQVWYSHKVGDQWCKGQANGNGGK